jgi:hypothetical protein
LASDAFRAYHARRRIPFSAEAAIVLTTLDALPRLEREDPQPEHCTFGFRKATSHPGMMGVGIEEQNLDELGNPGARTREDEVDAAIDGNSS